MGKKGVPDWLNSSLWSSPSPSPSPSHSPTAATAAAAAAAPAADSATDRVSRRGPAQKPVVATRAPPLPEPSPPHPHAVAPAPTPPPVGPTRPPASPPRQETRDTRGDQGAAGPVRFSPEEISRQSQLLSELSKKVINIVELRRLTSQGIPDGAGIRPTIWKLLLGYLPNDRTLWSSELSKKRSQFKAFRDELLVNPSEITRRIDESVGLKSDDSRREGSGLLPRLHVTHGEHPLSLGKTSVWNQFFQDNEIIEQIDRDVKRTHPDMNFFSGDTTFAKSNQEALKRILIIFAKLNPGIRYVQGMNEVLAPLYYVFRTDPDEHNAVAAEADTFFCFVELLSGFRDNFCQQLDNSVVGIRSTITKLSLLLKKHDEELWRHLEITTKVNPQFYAFRWITLLLTQEFNFADCLHIWDTLLSDPEGPQETLLRICCAMLILIRRRLLAGDFTSNLKLLQNYPPANISHLLYVANKLRGTTAG